jgi:hypothetical protein
MLASSWAHNITDALAPFNAITFGLCALITISTGRALARAWTGLWVGWLACLPLAACVRFLHYALFDDELLNPASFVITSAVTVLFYTSAYLLYRRHQMRQHYDWLTKSSETDDR